MRIVFMGTPDYSVKTMSALLRAGHEIAALFAQPDKPVGRKQILTPPATKQFAVENNIPVYQPNTLRDGKALEIIKEINPDVIVVVAYGKILPKEILEYPKYRCVNGHASLLPKYRGASPIQWSILCGESVTGVTTQIMNDGIDTGDILMTKEIEIYDNETAEHLFERLSTVSANLMVETLSELEKGNIIPVKQEESKATYAPIIKKEMALLDFNKNANEVYNAVRAFYSWPCAYFMLNGKRVKVLSSKLSELKGEPSTVVANESSLVIACKDKAIELVTVQPENSKAMSAAQMLCGHKIELGTKVN